MRIVCKIFFVMRYKRVTIHENITVLFINFLKRFSFIAFEAFLFRIPSRPKRKDGNDFGCAVYFS